MLLAFKAEDFGPAAWGKGGGLRVQGLPGPLCAEEGKRGETKRARERERERARERGREGERTG